MSYKASFRPNLLFSFRRWCRIYSLLYWVDCKEGGVELWSEILNSETIEHEWKWSCWNRSRLNIWSKIGVKLPWISSSPLVKGDCHVWSNTGFIRHGAVTCRILNCEGLTAYNVTSPLDNWTKFSVWLPLTLCGPPSKGDNISYLLSFVLSGPQEGGRSNCDLKFWIVKQENMNESGPAEIEVGWTFGPKSVLSCLESVVVHLWKETATFGLILVF